jgi:YYY domain-containing protein
MSRVQNKLLPQNVLVGGLLLVVMLAGGYFRFMSPNWDEYTLWHPDERHMTNVASKLGGPLSFTDADIPAQQAYCLEQYPATGGVGGFFDARCSTWNPNNAGEGLYVYGTLPQFAVRIGAESLREATSDPYWTSYYGVRHVGRLLSALAEMGVLFTVFLIGLHLHGKWMGLLAALLYAFLPFSIQQAHFWTADATANFFVAMTLFWAVKIQKGGGFVSYVFAGLAVGGTLASRVNAAPVVGLVILAAGLTALPLLDQQMSWGERSRWLVRPMIGLVLAGFAALLIFRFTQPYAFMGPGFFGLIPNQRWLQDIGEAQTFVSGTWDAPPNWQWVGRTPYIFPLSNMILWGMGIAVGLAGWIAFAWSLWRLIRGKSGALLNILLVVWVLFYFGWLGRIWVMTMRYYLPVYPALTLLAAWLLVELVRRADAANGRVRMIAARGLLGAAAVFTILWGLMFTNIYRQMFAPAQSTYWMMQNVPADFSMQIEGVDSPLINVPVVNRFGGEDTPIEQLASYFDSAVPFTQQFVAPADGVITQVHAPHLGDPMDDAGTETLRVLIGEGQTNAILATGTLVANLSREGHPLGNAYDIALESPLTVRAGEIYSFTVEAIEGGPFISSGPVYAWEGDWDETSLPKVCNLPPGVVVGSQPGPTSIPLNECQGTSLWEGHLLPQKLQIYWDDEVKHDLMVRVLDTSDYLVISTNRRYDTHTRNPNRWPMTNRFYEALFGEQLGFELVQTFQETYEFGPLRISDQHLPFFDSPRWLNEFEAEEAFHVYDHPAVMIFRKTEAYSPQQTVAILDAVPLTTVNTAFPYTCPNDEIAPGLPANLYYCSPDFIGMVNADSITVSRVPTALGFPPDLAQTQYSNGTWSARFDSQSMVNTQSVVTIIGWWLTIMAFGWVVWPLLFMMFPALADRGYSFAKAAGLVVISWTAWFLSSVRVPMWSREGLLAIMAVFAICSLIVIVRNRIVFGEFVRAYFGRILAIEVITLVAFLAFLAVRLTNPDLWHEYFGGEKPMDFAYFNGVLRSTVFPPIDPWHTGGYINYYYYGFVVVGAPVLVLGVVPSIAYNLIIPTLFALTGIGAFSVAFNLVSAFKGKTRVALQSETGESDSISVSSAARPTIIARMGNPWLAGISAFLLAVVLGNLHTPSVFVNEGLLRLGGFGQPAVIQQQLMADYREQNGTDAAGEVLNQLTQQAADSAASPFQSLLRGIQRLTAGDELSVAANRWYWAATRVLSETPGGGGNAIAEFPYFTFLYGDLHAHMISMPMMFLVMVFLLHEVLAARHDGRRIMWLGLALVFGGLVAGLLRATNTWDWITFMLLGVLGLGFAWWLTIQQLTRRNLISLALRVGAFVVASFLLVLPYTTWFASAYDSARLSEQPRTDLWQYLTVYGLFLFLLVSFLVLESVRWLRDVRVRVLRGQAMMVFGGLIVLVVILVAVLVLTLLGLPFITSDRGIAVPATPVTLLAVPLLLWIAVLFLRQGQSREVRYILALAGLAISLSLGVEYVVLDGDIGRQNTVFKFYLQAWLLLSVVGGASVAWLVQSSRRWAVFDRWVWYPVLLLLVMAAGAYPFAASRGRAQDRMLPELPRTLSDIPLTLNGMDYMQYAWLLEGDSGIAQIEQSLVRYPLAEDYQMIRWLQENVTGTPTIMEGQSDREYRWQARMAIYTGLPNVTGWRFHQTQQRSIDPLPRLVDQRVANVNSFYTTRDIPTAWRILQHYDVQYVIVGRLEQAWYPAAGLAKFDQMVEQGLLNVAYQFGESTIYVVNQDTQLALGEELAGGR